MTLRYLVDSSILSDLIRQLQGQVARQIALNGEDSVCTTTIVACELRHGAKKTGSNHGPIESISIPLRCKSCRWNSRRIDAAECSPATRASENSNGCKWPADCRTRANSRSHRRN